MTVELGPFAANQVAGAPTSGYTRLRINLPDSGLTRKAWGIRRVGSEIGPATAAGMPKSNKTTLLPGGGWSLSPFGGDMSNILTDDYFDSILAAGAGFDAAPGFTTSILSAPPLESMQPGVSPDGLVSTTGVPAIIKEVPQGPGLPWETARLTADQAAWPVVNSPEPNKYPMDRVAVGTGVHRHNTGYALFFESMDGGFDGLGKFLTLYFGGATEVRPVGAPPAGVWALSLYSTGRARLSELIKPPTEPDPWDHRFEFEWGNPHLSEGRGNAVYVIPYGVDRIAITTPRRMALMFSFVGLFPLIGGREGSLANRGLKECYHEQFRDGNHYHRHAMSGEGTFRVDSRRDVRKHYSFGRLKYPVEGTIVSPPFAVKGGVTGSTIIQVVTEHYFVPVDGASGNLHPAATGAGHAAERGSISCQLYDADTHAPLALAFGYPVGTAFMAVADQARYYPVFTVSASTDRYTSPILWAFAVYVNGFLSGVTSTSPVVVSGLQSVGVQGPSREAGNDSAAVSFHDPRDGVAIARIKDGIRSDIVVVNDAGVVYSRMYDGITSRVESQQRSSGETHFQDWWFYPNMRLIGMWHRFAEQVPLGLRDFTQDPSGAVDELGRPVPWRVVDIIRFLMNDCGVPNDEIDIPAYYDSVRLWPSPKLNAEAYVMQPGGDQPYLKLLIHLTKDYLGTFLVRDPNGGTRGLWRVLLNPTAATPSLCDFLQHRPSGMPPAHDGFGGPAMGGTRRLGTHPSTWGGVSTFISNPDETYQEWTERAEVNYVNVLGVADFDDEGKPAANCEAEWFNRVSHDFFPGTAWSALVDPTHPDHLGRFVPVYYVDPNIIGQAACNFVCGRISQVAGHGRRGARWRAPVAYVLNVDVNQMLPRPLRINDIVRVQSKDGFMRRVVLRQCNPTQRHDRMRMAEYEGVFV